MYMYSIYKYIILYFIMLVVFSLVCLLIGIQKVIDKYLQNIKVRKEKMREDGEMKEKDSFLLLVI